MSNELLSSKWILNEKNPEVRPIQGVPTSTPNFLGIAERGPLTPQLVTSKEEFTRIYGGYITAGFLRNAVEGFFGNGGQRCYVQRQVHYTDPEDAATNTSAAATVTAPSVGSSPSAGYSQGSIVGPYALAHNDTLVVAVDGGANQTATFTATAASRTSGNSETFALSNGQTLLCAIDGGAVQTVTFLTANFVDIANATAEEVAAVINASLIGASASGTTTVTITSDRKGTGSSVNVSGGTANTALAFTTGAIAGTGNVSNIAAVTVAEVITILEAAITGVTVSNSGGAVRITSDTTGALSNVTVAASSTADDELGFDNATHSGGTGAAVDTLQIDGKTDGTYAHALTARILAATSGEAARFNFQVIKGGVVIERFPNLTMDPDDARFVETIINADVGGSRYFAVTDLEAAVATFAAARPANNDYVPTGGNDGLVGIDDNDFIGGVGDNGRVGLRAFDLVEDASILAVPDRATAAVHNAMLDYCEITRAKKLFAILDPPAAMSAEGIVEYVETTASILELSEFGSLYWPRIKVANPSETVYGKATSLTTPPSGHVAGLYARNDVTRNGGGIYNAPAGTEDGILRGVTGVETDEVKDEDKRDLVYPKRVNPIRAETGRPHYVDGSFTLKSTGPFPSVPERRGAIFIGQSIMRGLQFARHRNNDEPLRTECTRICTTFLTTQMKLGAFRTKDPATAFFVDFGLGLNPPSVQFSGRLYGNIGLASNKPVQWGILELEQFTKDLQQELAA